MAKHKTGGWFRQPERHSRARKYGKAGGLYASNRIKTILKKHPEYTNLSYKELRGKGIFLKYNTDTDKDGVKNLEDCKPLNPNKQYLKETAQKVGTWVGKEAKTGYEKTKAFVKKETPIAKAWVKKEAQAVKEKVKKEYEEYQRKRKEAVMKALREAKEKSLIDEQTQKQEAEVIDKIEELQEGQEATEMSHELEEPTTPTSYPDLDVSHIFTKIETPEEAQRIAEKTSKAMTKVQHKNIEELGSVDVSELSDNELKMMAVRLGTGIFRQGNKFEDEIKRRIREREKIETDLKLELEKAQHESQIRLNKLREEFKTKEANKGQSFWDYITSSPKKRK